MQNAPRVNERGFTVIEVIGVLAIIAVVIMGIITLAGKAGYGPAKPTATVQRQYASTVIMALPPTLSTNGDSVTLRLEERVDTLLGSWVIGAGSWTAVPGASVQFRVTPNVTAVLGPGKAYFTTQVTDAAGDVTEVVYKGDAVGKNILVVTWSLPNGDKGVDSFPFTVN